MGRFKHKDMKEQPWNNVKEVRVEMNAAQAEEKDVVSISNR
jgi:hypothetical protein